MRAISRKAEQTPARRASIIRNRISFEPSRGPLVWFQLYPTDDWLVTQALVKRAEAAGALVIVLTVDRQGGRNTGTLFRDRRLDARTCSACHQPGFAGEVRRQPMWDDLDVFHATNRYGTGMTGEFVKRLRDITKVRLVLKGIVRHEDAEEATKHGVDELIVSNHGGRAEEKPSVHLRSIARDRGSCRWPNAGPRGRRLAAWNRRVEGSGAWSKRGLHWPPLLLEPRSLRPAGYRSRPRDHADGVPEPIVH